ncbi:hypothetical protein H4R33_003221 [Dimargaris cristalligena]|nr:hypothetical protein H4R33_003221 [Dimargaris cristalligena]
MHNAFRLYPPQRWRGCPHFNPIRRLQSNTTSGIVQLPPTESARVILVEPFDPDSIFCEPTTTSRGAAQSSDNLFNVPNPIPMVVQDPPTSDSLPPSNALAFSLDLEPDPSSPLSISAPFSAELATPAAVVPERSQELIAQAKIAQATLQRRIDYFSRRRNPLAMRMVLQAAQTRGLPPTPKALGTLVQGYFRVGNLQAGAQRLPELFRLADSEFIHRWVLASLYSVNILWILLEALDQFYRESRSSAWPDLALLQPIMSNLMEHKHHGLVMAVYRRFILQESGDFDPAAHRIGSTNASAASLLLSKPLLANHSVEAREHLFETLVTACHRYGEALRKGDIKSTPANHPTPLFHTFPTKTHNHNGTNYLPFVIDYMVDIILQDMPRAGLEPNLRIYNTLLRVTLYAGQHDGVHRLLDAMGQRGVVIDTVTYNILASGCMRHNQASAAELLVQYMTDRGLTAVLHEPARSAQRELALDSSHSFPWLAFVLPTVERFTMYGQGTTYTVTCPPPLMHTPDLKPDRITENTLIGGYLLGGQGHQAERQLQARRSDRASLNDPRFCVYTLISLQHPNRFRTLMKFYQRLRDHSEPARLGRDLEGHRTFIHYTVYSKFIAIMLSQNRLKLAMRVYEDMIQDAITYRERHSQRPPESPNPQFKVVKREGILLSQTLSIKPIAKARNQLTGNGSPQAAQSSLMKGAESQPKPPIYTPVLPSKEIFNLLIGAQCKANQLISANTLYRRMVQLGIVPNARTYYLIMRVYDTYNYGLPTVTDFLDRIIGVPRGPADWGKAATPIGPTVLAWFTATPSSSSPAGTSNLPHKAPPGHPFTDWVSLGGLVPVADLGEKFHLLMMSVLLKKHRAPHLVFGYMQLLESPSALAKLAAGRGGRHRGRAGPPLATSVLAELNKTLKAYPEFGPHYPQWL